MALFVIADLHLSLGADKPMDVFRGWEDYVSRLEQNWRAIVAPEDTVVIAGDISWAMKLEDTQADFAFLHSLPGTKLLLKGNHDYWWTTRAKMDAYLAAKDFHSLKIFHNCGYRVGDRALCGTRGWLYNAASAEDKKIVAREVGRLNASLEDAKKLGGRLTAFLHYPPIYGDMACQEIIDVLKANGVEECWFGHIHGQNAAKKALVGEYEGIRMRLISCDYVGFCPVLVDRG